MQSLTSRFTTKHFKAWYLRTFSPRYRGKCRALETLLRNDPLVKSRIEVAQESVRNLKASILGNLYSNNSEFDEIYIQSWREITDRIVDEALEPETLWADRRNG